MSANRWSDGRQPLTASPYMARAAGVARNGLADDGRKRYRGVASAEGISCGLTGSSQTSLGLQGVLPALTAAGVACLLVVFPPAGFHRLAVRGKDVEEGRAAGPADAHDLPGVAGAAGDVVVIHRDVRSSDDALGVVPCVALVGE